MKRKTEAMGDGVKEGDVRKETNFARDRIVTRSISIRNPAKPKPKPKPEPNSKPKPRKTREQTDKYKLYEVPGSGGVMHTHMTPEEYIACQKEVEDLKANFHLRNPPGHAKKQNDLLCRQFFDIMQKRGNEMVDYVLVEPMTVFTLLEWGCFAHMNFKAKHKDAEDSTAAIYFVEMDLVTKKVTHLAKLDIDLSADNGAYKRCRFCHPEDGQYLNVGGFGCVYHPVEGKLILR